MDDNLYDILTRHFLGNTTEEEERVVYRYKQENFASYFQLKQLFESRKITVRDFNSTAAWQNVLARYKQQSRSRAKLVPMYRSVITVAAAAVILLAAVLGIYLHGRFLHDSPAMLQAHGQQQRILLLKDGTKVWLNNDASLSYPTEFSQNNRVVKLTGEAFFDVAKNKDAPFQIETPQATIEVLGTSFNVNSKSTTVVAVKSGIVKVMSNSSGKYVTIKAGEAAEVVKEEVAYFEIANPNYNSWQTGVFVFSELPLLDVVNDLNTFYGNKLVLSTAVQSTCKLTARFDNAPLEEVLKVLQLTCGVSIDKSKPGVYQILTDR